MSYNVTEDVHTSPKTEEYPRKLQYHTDVFEGPLDLLLNLIAKNKVNICDIFITDLIDQYLSQIELMQREEMDIESDFLQMASRLIYIKSVMLLPKHREEAEELKKELTGQLIEYKLCKEIAGELKKYICFDYYTKEPSRMNFDCSYTGNHDPGEMVSAYISAVGRGKSKLPPPREAFSGIVTRKIVSVSSRIISVMRKLRKNRVIKYSRLFDDAQGKSEVVATFLAVLELVKGKRVRIDGDGENPDVRMI